MPESTPDLEFQKFDLRNPKEQTEAIGKFPVKDIVDTDGVPIVTTKQVLTRNSIKKLTQWGVDLSTILLSDTPLNHSAEKAQKIAKISELIDQDFARLMIETRQKHNEIKNKTIELVNSKKTDFVLPEEISSLLDEVIENLTKEDSLKELTLFNVFREDPQHEETVSHSIGVAIRCGLFGHYLMEHFPELATDYSLKNKNDLKILMRSGLLHDIGKVGIEKEQLYKVGKLTKEEKEEIDKHSQIGASILSGIDARIAQEHHNKTNQTNHRFSEIIHIIDGVDALAQTRSYRKAKKPIESLFIQFDYFLSKSYNPELFEILYKFQLKSDEIFVKNSSFELGFHKLAKLKQMFNFSYSENEKKNIRAVIANKTTNEKHIELECLLGIKTEKGYKKLKNNFSGEEIEIKFTLIFPHNILGNEKLLKEIINFQEEKYCD